MRRLYCFAAWVGFGVAMHSPAIAAPVLSIQPSQVTVVPDQSLSLGIFVTGVTDLYAFQVDFNFDPTILRVDRITEGPFLSGGGATAAFVPGRIDNSSGTIRATAETLIGAVPGVSGDGELAMIDFTVLGLGIRHVNLTGGTLLDSSLSGISFTTQPSVVAAVPEPESFGLAAAGMAALLLGIGIGFKPTGRHRQTAARH